MGGMPRSSARGTNNYLCARVLPSLVASEVQADIECVLLLIIFISSTHELPEDEIEVYLALSGRDVASLRFIPERGGFQRLTSDNCVMSREGVMMLRPRMVRERRPGPCQ